MDVSFLDDRVSFPPPLIQISICCMVQLSLPLTHSGCAPPLLLLRGMKYLFGQTVRSQLLRVGAVIQTT